MGVQTVSMKRKYQRGQQSFLGKGFEKPSDCFGGSLLKGNPKSKRPLDSKLPVHTVLRCDRSVLRLPKTFKTVDDILFSVAKKHGVSIYKAANVGNHLHLLVRVKRLGAWAPFIRELTGRIAQEVMGLVEWPNDLRFWKFRPFTRVVRGWKKAFQSVKEYIHLNLLEANGFISRKQTKTLKDLRMIWADG